MPVSREVLKNVRAGKQEGPRCLLALVAERCLQEPAGEIYTRIKIM